LESAADGPAGRRTVHGGGTTGGENVFFQSGIDVGVRLHVNQEDRKVGRIGSDGIPRDSLTLSARIPDGILTRVSDGEGPGIEG